MCLPTTILLARDVTNFYRSVTYHWILVYMMIQLGEERWHLQSRDYRLISSLTMIHSINTKQSNGDRMRIIAN